MNFTTITKACRETGLSYLGGINTSAKIIKNQKVSNNMTYIIYLAPSINSGYNVCSCSTKECRLGCLNTSGRAGMDAICNKNIIKNARINKTKLLFENKDFFMQWLITEIKSYQLKAKGKGYDFSVRLNGTSDIDYSKIFYNGKNIFELFSNVIFYDYTKNIKKYENKPNNYYLTFSYSGHNWDLCLSLLNKGFNVAVVFNINKSKPLPKEYKSFKVIDGDITDFRPNDTKGTIVGLRFKHIANKTVEKEILNSEFVVNI